jgi:hypothetical protein
MDFYDSDLALGVNNTFYGGADLNDNSRVGAFWSWMGTKQVSVTRRNGDPAADLVRMRIWKLETGIFLPFVRK